MESRRKKEFEEWMIAFKSRINNQMAYSGAITTISNHLKSIGKEVNNLYCIVDVSKLESIKKQYFSVEIFFIRNQKGNCRYSRAFDLYIEFTRHTTASG